MAELKPCPFCGGKAIFIHLATCHGEIACIGDCGFKSTDYWDEPMTNPREERVKWYTLAASAWNRRANDGK